MIHLRFLGAAQARSSGDDEELDLARRPMELALLAYLSLAGDDETVSRARLLPLLWPDADERQARHSLRQLLYRLGGRIEDDILIRDGDELSLRRDAVESDVRRFEEHYGSGRLVEALATYQGELLDGFVLEGAPEFQRWLDARRQDLRTRAVAAAATLSDSAEATGSLVEAAAWARTARTLAPWSEQALRRLMTLLQREGQTSEALEEYARAEGYLKEHFGTAPDDITQDLAARIRSEGAVTQGASVEVSSDTDEITPAALPPTSPDDPVARTPDHTGPGERSPALPILAGFAVLALVLLLLPLDRDRESLRSPPTGEGRGTIVVLPPDAPADTTGLEETAHGLTRALAWNLDGAGGFAAAVGAEPEVGRPLQLHTTVVRTDDGLRLDAILLRLDGSVLARSSVVGRPSDLPALADRLARPLLLALEDPDGTGFAWEVAAASDVTNPVLKRFLAGERRYRRGDVPAALPYFQAAIEADSTFALAHHRLATSARLLGETALAEKAAGDGLRHAENLSPSLRGLVQAHADLLAGRPQDASQVLRSFLELDPTWGEGWHQLGESLLSGSGTPEELWRQALHAFHRAAHLEGESVLPLGYLARHASWRQDRTRLRELEADMRARGGSPAVILEVRVLQAAQGRDPVARDDLERELAELDHYALEQVVRSVSTYGNTDDWALELLLLLDRPWYPPSTRTKAVIWKAQVGLAQGRFDFAGEALDQLQVLAPHEAALLQELIVRQAMATSEGTRTGRARDGSGGFLTRTAPRGPELPLAPGAAASGQGRLR